MANIKNKPMSDDKAKSYYALFSSVNYEARVTSVGAKKVPKRKTA